MNEGVYFYTLTAGDVDSYVELTARFCQPLRARPELQNLFKELETEAA